MVTEERWTPSFRCISSVYPSVSVYDRIAGNHADFAAAIEIEALTNPRIHEEAGDLRKIRPAAFISGKGTSAILAAFAYSAPSRFCDGTYGVYYAARDEATAIEESRYHTEKRLREWHEPSIDVDKRVYTITLSGEFDDAREKGQHERIYDPNDYSDSQSYARALYAANAVDGILYNSVRLGGGQCVTAFRPEILSAPAILKYVQFRWDGERIVGIAHLTDIRGYDA